MANQSLAVRRQPKRRHPLTLFSRPPLIAGEDAAAYEQLRSSVAASIKPLDEIEQLFVQDVVVLSFEIARYRHAEASLLTTRQYIGLERVLSPLLNPREAHDLARRWGTREPQAIEEVNKLLSAASLSMEDVRAQTTIAHIDQLDQIQHMTANAEARRIAALNGIDSHRSTLGQAPRRATEDVEEAEFSIVPPEHAQSGAVA
jgi:hypothetical protein